MLTKQKHPSGETCKHLHLYFFHLTIKQKTQFICTIAYIPEVPKGIQFNTYEKIKPKYSGVCLFIPSFQRCPDVQEG